MPVRRETEELYSLLKKSYENAPPFVQKMICCLPYRFLAGGEYRRAVVRRFRPFDALKEFPLLTKEIVQQNFKALVPKSLDRIPHHQGTTGGSTGNQLVILEDESAYAREKAYVHSEWRRMGYTPRCRKATFRGVAFRKITDSCFWQENPIHNELQFSPFHMSEEKSPSMCSAMSLRQPCPGSRLRFWCRRRVPSRSGNAWRRHFGHACTVSTGTVKGRCSAESARKVAAITRSQPTAFWRF